MHKIKSLIDFFIEYKNWVETGAQEGETFTRKHGLFQNLAKWCGVSHLTHNRNSDIRYLNLSEHLKSLLKIKYGENITPFNDGIYCYALEMSVSECHKNENRLMFVYEQIEEATRHTLKGLDITNAVIDDCN